MSAAAPFATIHQPRTQQCPRMSVKVPQDLQRWAPGAERATECNRGDVRERRRNTDGRGSTTAHDGRVRYLDRTRPARCLAFPIWQPTNLPIFQSSNLPIFQSSNLPIFQSSNLPIF